MITIKEIRKLESLSALSETKENLKMLVEDFNKIAIFVAQVLNADIEEIKNNKIIEINNLREDVQEKSMSVEDVLLNAPEKEGLYFTVPKVVD